MTSGRKSGLRRLGMIPLLIPIVFSSALFLIATQGLNLPARNWAMLVVGLGTIWYLFLWLGMRRVAIEGEVGALEASRPDGRSARGGGLARVLRSPGGLLSAVLGAALLVSGDRQVGAVLLGVGMLLLSLAQIRRR